MELYSEKDYKKTYQEIKRTLLNQKNKEKYSSAALIGGQPGSGKSQLARYLLEQNENTINVDGDYIREFFPHIKDIKTKVI